ncbi:hypothetical protein EIN_380940 [Entamoeba invadens IP1]|uniref:Uncharacterized protein n=1 Tax=Entamoeba invadens IP1 TaxID=370355 RepID=A0A0A1UAQ0_ENTIV|nr:hypothetical protein EIN_380940 [Entamoeba invadens IP1]ELP92137.1 hypothetical protein EIN_380940 [Entamoeba invadens IP1]|eukprot:XP_004258908.1 hypothetical protein EIN_380940 [Entamoeba invadens IP1]
MEALETSQPRRVAMMAPTRPTRMHSQDLSKSTKHEIEKGVFALVLRALIESPDGDFCPLSPRGDTLTFDDLYEKCYHAVRMALKCGDKTVESVYPTIRKLVLKYKSEALL